MTDFGASYSCEWHLYKVNRTTWADEREVGRLISASVSRDSEGTAPEIDSGTLTVEGPIGWEWEPGYYRLAMRAEQNGVERHDIATLLCESDGGSDDYGLDVKSVTGFSVLHPAARRTIDDGDFAAAGEDGAKKAARLLAGAINAPVSVEGSFALADHYNFAPGSSVLESAWQILKAGNFCMWADGRGVVHIGPLPIRPTIMLDRAAARMVDSGVSHAMDLSSVPNLYIAVLNGVRAKASNHDGPKVSYSARGYWHDEYDDSPTLLEGESLDAYAARRLAELSIARDSRTYTRRYMPDAYPFMLVGGSMPSEGLDGNLRIVSQAIDSSNGIRVTETVCKEVALWP